MCFFSKHTVSVVTYVRSLASTYLPCSVAVIIDYYFPVPCSVAVVTLTMLAYGDRRQGFGAPSSARRFCSAVYACSLAVHCGLALGQQAHPFAHTNQFFACAPPFAGSDLEL